MAEPKVQAGDQLLDATNEDYYSTYAVEAVTDDMVALRHTATGQVTFADHPTVNRFLAGGTWIKLRGDRT